MTREDYCRRVERLYEAADSYYSGKPILTDEEFDAEVRDLREFQKAHPEFKLEDPIFIGEAHYDTMGSIYHNKPMLSLEDVFYPNIAAAWCAKVLMMGSTIGVEPKVDGVSVKATYIEGELDSLSTRGNGHVGTDITDKAGFINGIPDRLLGKSPNYLEVRGELYILEQDFQALNVNSEFSNQRNLAAGTIGANDPMLCQDRKLQAIFYDVHDSDMPEPTHFSDLIAMEAWGLPVVESQTIFNASIDVMALIKEPYEKAKALGIPVDGVVAKCNDKGLYKQIGETAHHPKYMIAYKFKEQEATVTVNRLEWQVSRSGVVTPVAIFEPIKLAGTIVTNVTCHNMRYVLDNGIGAGALIVVYKSGGIIPKIARVIEPCYNASVPISVGGNIPLECPSCGEKLYFGDVRAECHNTKCPERLAADIVSFCSPKAMRINNIGKATADMLVEMGAITNPLQLVTASIEELRYAGLTKSKAADVFESIEVMRRRPDRFFRFIFALGIPGVGPKAALTIGDQLLGGADILEVLSETEREYLTSKYGNLWFSFLQSL